MSKHKIPPIRTIAPKYVNTQLACRLAQHVVCFTANVLRAA